MRLSPYFHVLRKHSLRFLFLCQTSSAIWAHGSLLPIRGSVDVARYRLPEAENAAIYERDIAPLYFSHAKPSRHPMLIIVTGQPGSGKSTLLRKIQSETALSDFVSIEKDTLHVFHPLHSQLRLRLPYFPNADTLKDADAWFDKVMEEAFRRRVDIVLHRGSVVPGGDLDWLTVPSTLGYRIEVRAIATAFAVSEQSVVERYEIAKGEGPGARMSCQENHRKYFDNLPRVLDEVERRKLAARVTVVARRGDILYDNALTYGMWEQPISAAQVVERERERPLSVAELDEQCARVARTVARMEGNGSRVDDPRRYETMVTLRARVCPDINAPLLPLSAPSDAAISPFGVAPQPM